MLLITLSNWLPCFPLVHLSFFREAASAYMASNVSYPLHTYVDNPKRYRGDLGSPGMKHHLLTAFDPHFYPGRIDYRATAGEGSCHHLGSFSKATRRTTRQEDLRQDLKAIQQNQDTDGPQLPEKTAYDLQWLRAVGYYSP